MSQYKDFTQDFPSRCLEILQNRLPRAKLQGREVTLLLMVTSSAFLVPYERLRPDKNHLRHPSGDRDRFEKLVEKLDELMAEKFSGSKLCPNMKSSWKFAEGVPRVNGDLDSWFPPQKLQPVSKEKQISSMLALIRNALAHGNLFTTGDPIESLIFVSKKGNELDPSFQVLSVEPDDFYIFISAWVELLSPIRELYLVA